MKFLIVCFAEYPGSTASANHISRLSHGLTEAGHEVTVTGFGGTSFKRGTDNVGTRYTSFPGVHKSLSTYLTSTLRFGNYLSKSLHSIIAEESPNHLIYHGRSFWVGEIIRRHCRQSRIPMTPYQVEWYSPTALRILNCSYIDQVFFRLFTIPRCGHLIGISQFWKTWGKSMGIPCEVIPALNPPVPSTLRLQKPNQPFQIAFVGGLHRRELPSTLFQGVSLALKNGVDLNLTIIGKPPSNLRRFKDGKDTGLALARTTFTGWLSEEQLWNVLFTSHAAILLRTENRETRALFPTRLPEYLSAGLPVIASSAGDISTYLEDGVNALLIPPGNRPADLAIAIQKLADTPGLLRTLSVNSIKTAKGRFDPCIHARRLVNFLESLPPIT